MPRFFVSKESIYDGAAVITGDDAGHISRSLRMRVGEELMLCDGEGTDYVCVIDGISSSEVRLRVTTSLPSRSEPPYRAVVFQALARGDKTDTVVQRAVEYGAVRIVPFSSDRCNVKLSREDGVKKSVRWQRIAEEAAKQSMRGVVPEVLPPVSFDEMLQLAGDCGIAVFCWEHAVTPLRDVIEGKRPESISVVIGPEGGFSDGEAAAAEAAGLVPVSLGRRILRTESAAQFALACFSYEFESQKCNCTWL